MSIQVIGHKFKVDFGQMSFLLHFESAEQLTWTTLSGGPAGDGETVKITMTLIRPDVYMVYWVEPKHNGNTVTHVEDFANGVVYTNITTPDNGFINLKGTLTLVE